MKNVNITTNGNIVTITFDRTKDYGPSTSGKTNIIASTEGNASVVGLDDCIIGLNVFKKVRQGAPAKHTTDAKALAKDFADFAKA